MRLYDHVIWLKQAEASNKIVRQGTA